MAAREVKFDLRGENKDLISSRYLDNLSLMLNFEKILQYVFIPRITVEKSDFSTRRGQLLQEDRTEQLSNGYGARHYEELFGWLRAKGVKRILKVCVDDSDDFPHRDTVIQRTLEAFQIEIWDWQKFDICIDTIYHASEDVQEVHLYSSGNLAVLQNWSSADGLGRLSNVRSHLLGLHVGLEFSLQL
jgi:hypothetical protein